MQTLLPCPFCNVAYDVKPAAYEPFELFAEHPKNGCILEGQFFAMRPELVERFNRRADPPGESDPEPDLGLSPYGVPFNGAEAMRTGWDTKANPYAKDDTAEGKCAALDWLAMWHRENALTFRAHVFGAAGNGH